MKRVSIVLSATALISVWNDGGPPNTTNYVWVICASVT
jgi:hypothetical protein